MLIQVYRFFTEYKPGPNGDMVGSDYVEYGPPQAGDRTRIIDRVSRLMNVQTDSGDNGMNMAISMASQRRDAIAPLYEAWKKGQELPEDGTPIGSWNFLSAEQVDIFKMHSIKTVEAIAAMNDAARSRIPLPGMGRIIEAAKTYLAAGDQRKLSAELEQRDIQIEALRTQIEEMKALMKRPVGRPRKDKDEPAVGDEAA